MGETNSLQTSKNQVGPCNGLIKGKLWAGELEVSPTFCYPCVPRKTRRLV